MSKGTGGQGGGGKKKKKNTPTNDKPSAPKGTNSTFGGNPSTDRSRGPTHSQNPYGQPNAASIPRRTTGG